MTKSVLLTIDQRHIAWMTLNRPEIHNAFDGEMIQNLTTHFQTLKDNPSIRALVIQGEGKSFCAGADLSWMKESVSLSEAKNLQEAQDLSHMFSLLDTLPFPTICAVQGSAMGGGIGLIACSDIAIADPQTKFGFSEIKLGLVPAIISPYVVRSIGPRFARRYCLTGESFQTAQAHAMGLIHEVTEQHHFKEKLEDLLEHILKGGPKAIKEAKTLIHRLSGDISNSTRDLTIELIANLRLSEEGRQGMLSFLEKTAPPWVSSHD